MRSLGNKVIFLIALIVCLLVVFFWTPKSQTGVADVNPQAPKTTPTSKAEEECRKILAKLFRVPFPSCRPDFLKNPRTGRNLELDCYNEDLKLALEYNGPQHYNNKVYNMSEEDYIKLLQRDVFKKKKCAYLGIDLIIVPYRVKFSCLEEFIVQRIPERLRSRMFID